jgi:hypothetical protein
MSKILCVVLNLLTQAQTTANSSKQQQIAANGWCKIASVKVRHTSDSGHSADGA